MDKKGLIFGRSLIELSEEKMKVLNEMVQRINQSEQVLQSAVKRRRELQIHFNQLLFMNDISPEAFISLTKNGVEVKKVESSQEVPLTENESTIEDIAENFG